MKVKEVSRPACTAWSPASCHPIYIASGTAANQTSASFDSDSNLELFDLGLGEAGYDMRVAGRVALKDRLYSLVWADATSSEPRGLLIGGCDEGVINMWSASRVLSGEDSALVHSLVKHTAGAVQSLDMNPFQKNLLVSGGSASEVYICDLNEPEKTMYPGAKEQPAKEIVCVRWNCQVQHILGSVCVGGPAVIWDLRKQGPIIKVRDSSMSGMAWHPAVPTQMVTASQDDRHPVIQMWDLRFANSPMKIMDKHQGGVLGVAWCPHDPDLLISCAKDGRIICWDPNSQTPGGEIVCELPSSGELTYDVQWCPRNPAVVSAASIGSRLSVFSLMGGAPPESQSTAAQIEDSFGQSFGAPIPTPITTNTAAAEPCQLKKAPKWVRPPVGARFAFGGKLVSFGVGEAGAPKVVHISQVVTDQEFLERSNSLEQTLSNGQFAEFCRSKADTCLDERQKRLWNFLQGNFEDEPRKHFLQLLGYTPESLAQLVSTHTGSSISEITSRVQQMGTAAAAEDQPSLALVSQLEQSSSTSSEVANIQENVASAFDKFGVDDGGPRASPFAGDGTASPFDELVSGKPSGLDSPQKIMSHLSEGGVSGGGTPRSLSPFVIQTDSSLDGVISQALLVGDFEAAVNLCLNADRMTDALILAIAGGPNLLAYTQQHYLQRQKSQLAKLMSAVIQRDLSSLVARGQLANWPQLLAALITYAPADEFTSLCERLGQRLEEQGDQHLDEACLCYICSGSLEKLISCWTKQSPVSAGNEASLVLQDLIEKVVILRQALSRDPHSKLQPSVPALADKLSAYAEVLASQGARLSAIRYLQQADGSQENVAILMDRLYHSDVPPQGMPVPRTPFTPVSVVPERPATTAPAAPVATQPVPQENTQWPGYGGPRHYQPQPTLSQPVHHPIQPPFPTQSPTTTQPSNQPFVPTQRTQQPSGMYTGGQVAQAVQQPSTAMPTQIFNPATVGPNMGVTGTGPGRTTQPPFHAGGAPYNPAEHVPPSLPPVHRLPASETRAKEGWNDPPAVLMAVSKPSTQAGYHVEPITTPLPMENKSSPTVPHYPNAPQGPAGVQQPPPSAPEKPTAPVAQPAPTIKAPIPSEHQPMIQVFSDLLERCQQAATNAMMKRKGEDVAKRLEVLKDHIRQGTVSPTVLGSLHNMSRAAASRDYPSALHEHTAVVSSSNFSQISTYMTGLKTLLQLAQQLRI